MTRCRPIARTLLRMGPLVAAMTSPRDLFRVALHADANAIAVVRGEPGLDVQLTSHDRHALKRFDETAGYLSIQFVDYLIISAWDGLCKPLFHSWRMRHTGTASARDFMIPCRASARQESRRATSTGAGRVA